MKGIIQIAGVIDQNDADILACAGVHRIGFPFELDHHKEEISEERAAEIIKSLKPPASAVLITYTKKAQRILSLCRRLGVSIVQLHGDVNTMELAKLKKMAPDLSLVKSLIVKNNNLEELKSSVCVLSPYIDAFITDTYDPLTGASGATGKVHDWEVSRWLVELSAKPVMLAGGLNPGNVREAILYVRPAGVDSHTGVEDRNGRKDTDLTKEFVKEATSAFAIVRHEG